MKTVTQIIDKVLEDEGEKFTNHPSDLGGPTKWGITQKALSAYLRRPATVEEVKQLTRAAAYLIYYDEYVVDPGFKEIHMLAPALTGELVDTGVNVGPARAALWLQIALNGMNKRGTLYPDLVEDADIGPATMNALKRHLALRGLMGELVLARAVDSQQGAHYLSISRSRPANEDFTYGWFANRVGGH
jgi:lysozyme family protein